MSAISRLYRLLASCWTAAFVLILTSHACVEFERISSQVLPLLASRPCSAVTITTAGLPSPHACAMACASDQRCFAFRHNVAALRCALLTAPCSTSVPEEDRRLMVRRPQGPLTWRFKGSFYFMSQEKGSFAEMGEVCARYGMYRWAPSSLEEVEFIEQQVLPKLQEQYYRKNRYGKNIFKFWIGVTDKPNGNCTLTDLKIKCPLTRYTEIEPNSETEECVQYRAVDGMTWNDVPCERSFFAFCEGLL